MGIWNRGWGIVQLDQGFLSDRKQRGRASKWPDVAIGVPQGSVLGPSLFLLYIK